MKTAEQNLWVFSQDGEALVQSLANVLFGLEDRILDGALDISMAKFFFGDYPQLESEG